MLYDQIKENLTLATKTQQKEVASILRVLIGEIQRRPNKNYEDVWCLSVINKTINNLKTINTDKSKLEISILESFLPKKISDNDICDYLNSLDRNEFKTIPQFMKAIMSHFPKGTIDGTIVKNIVTKFINN